MHNEKNSEESFTHHSDINPWSDFLTYSTSHKKKKNSRSKSMFEITENPYADDNCCCCDLNNHDMTTKNSVNSSLIYSLFTSSTTVASNNNSSNPSITQPPSSTNNSMCLFLLKFSQVLISSGAPSHRLDYCLQLLLEKLNIKAQFGYFPGFLVVSFGDLGMCTFQFFFF